MMALGLTKMQRRVLDFIAECARDRGMAPSVKEIAAAIGDRSASAAHRLLVGLRERGHIAWTPGMTRSIVLIPQDRARHTLPPDLQAKLEKYCADHDERPTDVLADALALHFDALEATGANAIAAE